MKTTEQQLQEFKEKGYWKMAFTTWPSPFRRMMKAYLQNLASEYQREPSVAKNWSRFDRFMMWGNKSPKKDSQPAARELNNDFGLSAEDSASAGQLLDSPADSASNQQPFANASRYSQMSDDELRIALMADTKEFCKNASYDELVRASRAEINHSKARAEIFSKMKKKELLDAYNNDPRFIFDAYEKDLKRARKLKKRREAKEDKEECNADTHLLMGLGAIALGCAIFHKD